MTNIPEYGKDPVSRRWQLAKRWLIRLGIAFGVMAVVVPLSVLVWGGWEGRQFQIEIAALQAAGEPAVAGDLDAAPIPASANSVPDLRAAAKVIDSQMTLYKKVEELNDSNRRVGLPLRDDERAAIRAAQGRSSPAFPLVESAAKKPRTVVDVKFTSPMQLMAFPDLLEQRQLAVAMSYAAYDAQSSGDTAAALRHVNNIFPSGRFADQIPTLVGHLVSIGIDTIAIGAATDIASDAGRFAGPLRPETTREAQALIAQLLDESETDAGLRRALRGDRVMAIDSIESIMAGKWSNNAGGATQVGRFPRAYLLRNARGISWAFSDVLTSLEGAEDLPTFRAAYAGQPRVAERSPRMYMLGSVLMPSVDRAIQVHFRHLADRRLAATALAILLYRADHDGAFPRTLSDLVPKYLPDVPVDPLASRGATIGYVVQTKRPRVYSVGENGIDNGGTPLDPEKTVRENMQVLDDVVDLVQQPRPTAEPAESEESIEP